MLEMVDLRECDPDSSPDSKTASRQYTPGAAAAAKVVVDKPYKIMTAYDDSDEDEQPPNLPPEAAPSAPIDDSDEDEQPPNLPPETAPSAPIVLSDDSDEDEQQLQSSSSKAAPSAPPPSRNLSDESDLSDALTDEVWNAMAAVGPQEDNCANTESESELPVRQHLTNIKARLKVRQKLKKLRTVNISTLCEYQHKTEGEGEQKLKKGNSEKEHKTAGDFETGGDFETEGDFKTEGDNDYRGPVPLTVSEQMTEGEGEPKLKKVKTEGDFETGGDIATIENFLRRRGLDPFTVTESEQKNEGEQELKKVTAEKKHEIEGEQKLQKVKAEKKHKTEGEQKLQKVETEKEHKTEGEHNIDQMPKEKDRELHDDSSKGQLSNRKNVLNIIFLAFPEIYMFRC